MPSESSRAKRVKVRGGRCLFSLLACAVVVPILFASACAKSDKNESGKPVVASPASSRITFIHYFSGSLSGGIDALVRGFNAANPGNLLSAIPLDHEAFKSSILETFRKGNPPELYSYWAGAKTLSISDNLLPLDEVWKSSGLDADFPAPLVESASRYKGSIYLLPLTQHYVGFFYSKSAFAAAKLEAPRDWPSFLAACEKLKRAGFVPLALGARDRWPAQFWFDYLLLRTAGVDFRKSLMAGRASWTDARVVHAFKLWKELLGSNFFNPRPNEAAWDRGAADSVSEGRAAMTLMGTWLIGTWAESAPKWKEGSGYGFFPFPAIDRAIDESALGPVDGIVIPKMATNTEGAKKAIAYLASAASQEAMSRGSGAIAPNVSVPDSAYSPIQRQVKSLILGAKHWAFNYDLATSPERSEIGLGLFTEFLEFPERYLELLAATETSMYKLGSEQK